MKVVVAKIRYRILKVYPRTQLAGGRDIPSSFFKIEKKVPWFWKKCPDCVHLRVNQNSVLRVSRRKNSKIFTLRDLSLM